VLPQEQRLPAPRHAAFRLALGTDAEGAEPPQVTVRRRLQDEDVDLVVGDSDLVLGEEVVERAKAAAT
jgi:hypothetical protein